MKKLILFLVLGVLLSCQSTDNRRLETTLDLAQSIRGELEKVIQYYSQNEADSLKLKAARFLIMNMPGHYSFIGRNYENYCKASEKIIFSKTSMNKKVDKLNKLIRQYPAECFERVEDCSIITADYLIQNINIGNEETGLKELLLMSSANIYYHINVQRHKLLIIGEPSCVP